MRDIHGGNVWEASSSTGLPVERIIDFSASINPLGLPPGAVKAVRNGLGLIPPYPDPAMRSLKEALAAFHCVAPAEVLPANGSTELIYLIPRALKPSHPLVVEPSFSEYRRSLSICGIRASSLVLKEEDGFRLDIGRLRRRLDTGVDLVYIANPANPAGNSFGADLLNETASECRRAGAVLVVDEAFADFSGEESLKALAARARHCVVLRSMTKFFSMAGLRLGCLIAHKDIVKKFSSVMPPWSVNTVASIAGIEAVKDPGYIKRTRNWLLKERAYLHGGLEGIRGLKCYPSSANFIMARILSGQSAGEIREGLFKRGILIRDLSGFRGLGPEYFRVAVRKRAENGLLLKALRQLLRGS